MCRLTTAFCWKLAVAASFVVLSISGVTWGFTGLLFVALINDNGRNRGDNAWPFSMVYMMNVLAAPVLVPLSTRFSLKTITMAGVILSALGSIVCYLSTDFYVVCVFFGGIRGFGTIVSTTLTQTIFNNEFKKYRATAMSLNASVSQIGNIVSPFLGQYLLDSYGLKGTFLLLGGIMLHGAIGAILLVPSEELAPRKLVKELEIHDYKDSTCKISITSETEAFDAKPTNYLEQYGIRSTEKIGNSKTSNNNDDVETRFLEEYRKEIEGNRLVEDPFGSDKPLINQSINHSQRKIPNGSNHDQTNLLRLNDRLENEMLKSATISTKEGNTIRVDILSGSNRTIISDSKKTKSCCDMEAVKDLLKNKYFLLIAQSQAIQFSTMFVVSVIFIDYARDKGISQEKSLYFLPIFSAFSLIGKLGFGWISDRNYVSKSTYLGIGTSILPILYLVVIYVSEFELLVVCVALFALLLGNLIPVSMVLYGEFLDKEQISTAVSLGKTILGIEVIVRTLLLGVLRDGGGSYDYLLFMNSGIALLVALFWCWDSIQRHHSLQEDNISLKKS